MRVEQTNLLLNFSFIYESVIFVVVKFEKKISDISIVLINLNLHENLLVVR